MSNRSNRNKNETKGEPKDHSTHKHYGPSGFQIYEYKGAGKDHTAEWIRFQKNLKGAILTHKLDNLLERIIDKGKLPKLPSTDKKALLASAPKKTIRVSELFDTDNSSSSDSDDEAGLLSDLAMEELREDNISLSTIKDLSTCAL